MELRPGRLGVDVVDRHRRDAAPVVDAGVEQTREVAVGEVRRRLHVPLRAQQDARGGDRPEVVVDARLGVIGHARARLGAEILDDHLLDVAVPVTQLLERQQSLQPLLARLADPDQDPTREGDRELAREADRLETHRRVLVGRGPVRAAATREPLGGGLEHDPHRRRDRPQRDELLACHHTRVQVRQQAGLVEDEAGHPRQVLERRVAAERAQLVAGDLVAHLRLVAEREQRLRAAPFGTGLGDSEHRVGGHVRALAAARWPGEGAVAADVAAQRRQRDEDLGGVGDERPRPQPARLHEELVERGCEQILHL